MHAPCQRLGGGFWATLPRLAGCGPTIAVGIGHIDPIRWVFSQTVAGSRVASVKTKCPTDFRGASGRLKNEAGLQEAPPALAIACGFIWALALGATSAEGVAPAPPAGLVVSGLSVGLVVAAAGATSAFCFFA